jgi:phosphate transport system permease protein
MTDVSTPAPLRITDLSGDPRRVRRENLMRRLFRAAAYFSLVVSAAIILSLVFDAVDFLLKEPLGNLWGSEWTPRLGRYDIKTIVVGSALVTAVAMVIAAPLGMGAAIYLSEYASPRVRRVLKPVLEILAGIPSVVLGFFAISWLAPNIVSRFFNPSNDANLMVAGIGVGVLVIPLVASIAEDAMRSVPQALREASYGMGATKVTTVTRVVLPAAVSGLAAAFIIAVSRAIGETMVVALAAGAVDNAKFTADPLHTGFTMTAAMASIATGTDNVKGAANTVQSLYFVGLLLFLITLSLNLVADRFVRRFREEY